MALSVQEAFRYGFLLRCTEEGLSFPEMEKRAAIGIEKLASPLGLVKDIGSTGLQLLRNAGLLGIGGAIGVGGGLGLLAANATSPETTVDDYKKQELIEAYKLQASLAKQRQQAAARHASKPKPMWGNV
jgi:hypothetical protein